MMGQYQMKGSEYLFTSCRKYAFFMAPFQSALLSTTEDLFMDVTSTGNDFFPYLLNVVSFNDETCVYNAVARVICSWQDSESYAKSIATFFLKNDVWSCPLRKWQEFEIYLGWLWWWTIQRTSTVSGWRTFPESDQEMQGSLAAIS